MTRLMMVAGLLVLVAGSLLFFNQPTVHSRSAAVALREVQNGGVFEVRAFGAKGDGKTLDSPAVNKAIDAAAAAGGGTVRFSAGTYRCFSIRLKSNVALYLDQGSTILAADPKDGDGNLRCVVHFTFYIYHNLKSG